MGCTHNVIYLYWENQKYKVKITGTFLDEISHDIPHQNWGEKEWRQDFQYMQAVGIDTVILIRCGYKVWMTYPSAYLRKKGKILPVYQDLVQLFLDLSLEFDFSFFFGLYDSGHWFEERDFNLETELNLNLIDEVWSKYGSHKAFSGWYINHEISRKDPKAIRLYQHLGSKCKDLSKLPVLISPYIEGPKAILSHQSNLVQETYLLPEQHLTEWREIFTEIESVVDIVAFQDGHVDFKLLKDYMMINKGLADEFGLQCWSNLESFDRDMPIKFLPIKWDKLRFKIETAREVGLNKLITFEFSHFMSPQSAYGQAPNLYNRYTEYINNEL